MVKKWRSTLVHCSRFGLVLNVVCLSKHDDRICPFLVGEDDILHSEHRQQGWQQGKQRSQVEVVLSPSVGSVDCCKSNISFAQT